MEKKFIPSGPSESEFTEKKSRFISLLFPVSRQDEIRDILKKTRQAHPQSRHVVWAYILGDSRSVFGLSDDGEPHGTAGRPVLEVLKGSGLTDTLILVIRYFGGIKLGTGGLVSAYTRAAQDVLTRTERQEKISRTGYDLTCPYPLYEQIRKSLVHHGGIIDSEDFSSDVRISFSLPDAETEDCSNEIRDISSGRVALLKENG